ncbi:HAD-like domain-containing protein [Irpex rosettiformis]|uniref:HAD-like domain-containing protein n=1 Tax=Irpex rosettiformis TaxID=378272 RepID=A0ACB8U230_9APHY|nr:HAD-like domain-containing protein [Irpex rosettiformis]
MANLDLRKFKALIFDCYGTLVDWEEGIYQAIQPMIQRVKPPISSREDVLLAFTNVEKDLQAKYPTMLYKDILAHTHAELAARLQNKPAHPDDAQSVAVAEVSARSGDSVQSAITTAGTSIAASVTLSEARGLTDEDIAFGNSVGSWKPFPDTIPALKTLSNHYKLTILSNVDNDSFSKTRTVLERSDPNYQFEFDGIYTAQDIGSYKPDLANFEYALKKLKDNFGIEKHEVLITACSLLHDHVPANQLKMNSVWVARDGAVMRQDPSIATYDLKFTTLGAMAEEVEKKAGTK